MMGQNYVMASDADIATEANKLMASMVNVPFKMKVKSNGDVLDVVGYEKVIEAMKSAMPDSPSAKEFEKSYTKEQIFKILNQLFCNSSKTCKSWRNLESRIYKQK
jgi:hypothetical protein